MSGAKSASTNHESFPEDKLNGECFLTDRIGQDESQLCHAPRYSQQIFVL